MKKLIRFYGIVVMLLLLTALKEPRAAGPYPSQKPFIISTIVTSYPTKLTSSTTDPPSKQFSKYLENQRKIYIAQNFEYLEEEGGIGSGQHLEALASLLGCSTNHHSRFAVTVKAHYPILFNGTSQSEVFLEKLKIMISKNDQLRLTCLAGTGAAR